MNKIRHNELAKTRQISPILTIPRQIASHGTKSISSVLMLKFSKRFWKKSKFNTLEIKHAIQTWNMKHCFWYYILSSAFSLASLSFNLEDYTTTKVFWIDVILTLRKHGWEPRQAWSWKISWKCFWKNSKDFLKRINRTTTWK